MANDKAGGVFTLTSHSTVKYALPETTGFVLTSNGPGVAPSFQAFGGSGDAPDTVILSGSAYDYKAATSINHDILEVGAGSLNYVSGLGVTANVDPIADDLNFSFYSAISGFAQTPNTNTKIIYELVGVTGSADWAGADGITNGTEVMGMFASASSSTDVSHLLGLTINTTARGNVDLNAAIYGNNSTYVGTSTKQTAFYAQSTIYGSSAVASSLSGLYVVTPVVANGGTVTANYGVYLESQAGIATNSYDFWADEQGVFRIKADNPFDSVYQAIPVLYNPQFTKYTAGATNYERLTLAQWSANVAQITTEKGGSGTLRGMTIGASGSVPVSVYGVAPVTRQVLATGAGHTVDQVITVLQNFGICSQT